MAHQIEFDPTWATPEYWGGIDIRNPEHFQQLPSVVPEVTWRNERAAAKHLATILHGTYKDLYGEHVVLDETLGTDDWGHHAVAAIETEELMLRHHDQRLANAPDEPRGRPTQPIILPFGELWRNNQPAAGRMKTFGDEEAYMAVGHDFFKYTRSVLWGVLTKASSGQQAIATWRLDAATANDHGRVSVQRRPGDIQPPRPVPLKIGTAQPFSSVQTTSAEVVRRVERVREVHIVRSFEVKQERLKLPRGGRRARVGSLINSVVPRPTPGWSC